MIAIAVVLGSAAAALEEFNAAKAFLKANHRPLHVVCVNDAIKVCPVKPVAFCTIHSVGVPSRFIPPAMDTSGVKMFTHRPVHGFDSRVVRAKWQGTSGLYGVQIALDELGFAGVILAGVPMDAGAGTNYGRETWADDEFVAKMRPEWLRAMPTLKDRTRSMSGWTRALLGEPTSEWALSLTPPNAGRGQ